MNNWQLPLPSRERIEKTEFFDFFPFILGIFFVFRKFLAIFPHFFCTFSCFASAFLDRIPTPAFRHPPSRGFGAKDQFFFGKVENFLERALTNEDFREKIEI